MSVSYNGSIGSFEYDPEVWEIVKDTNNKENLHYKDINTPFSGKDITVPKGVTDYTGLFENTRIRSGIRVPDGVTSTERMMAGCYDLIEGSIVPDSVTNQAFMYDGDINLQRNVNISPNAVNLDCFAANCRSLEEMGEIPDSAKSAESMLQGCRSLSMPVHGGRNLENINAMFAGCESLEDIPADINPNAKGENVFEGCSKLYEADYDKTDSLSEMFKQAEKQSENAKQHAQPRSVDRTHAADGIAASIDFGISQDGPQMG